MTGQKHPLRCETCDEEDGCPVVIYIKKNKIGIPPPLMSYAVIITAICGCASHSDARSADVVERDVWFPSSEDLLLIANDEWKRREERRHIHDTVPWVHGWINGFLTSRKFAKEQLEKIHKQAELRKGGRE